MEMVAAEDIDVIGEDLTPPLSPLAFSLHDSNLLSHCSSCFSPLNLPDNVPSPILYCSSHCSASDSSIHLSSAAHHLQSLPFTYTGDTSDLRTALRLLFLFEKLGFISQNDFVDDRICGLMSNREKLVHNQIDEGNDDVLLSIKEGAKAMAAARRKRDGLNFKVDFDCVVEEALLCVVLTNAVEVQDKAGRFVGIAVYDTDFSWINHSCSPSACYWFLQPGSGFSASPLRLAPAAMDCGGAHAVLNKYKSGTSEGCNECGPRIVVRAIKAIQKGEAVTIAYTDLLQPKEMRQSDLWLKYRLTCQCRRCIARPLTYVDHALQGMCVLNLQSFNQEIYQNRANEELTDYIDDAIAQYLSHGDAELCCHKLENVLTDGLLRNERSELNEVRAERRISLHPLHHLSLNAYRVLASAYNVRASDLSAENPETYEDCLYVFRMNCISAAYSFLLSDLAHHLFLSESSLVASVANFWSGAGESLLNLSRSSMWNMFPECQFSALELPSPHGYKCSMCTLLDNFEATFGGHQMHISEFEEISRKFIDCIRSIRPKVWSFLVQQNKCLGMVTDPIDFRWHSALSLSGILLDRNERLGSSDTNILIEDEQPANQGRTSIFHLSVHCLLYGGLLSSICGGQDSYSVRHVRDLVYG